MKIINTPIPGLKILEPKIFKDARGEFIKILNYDFLEKNGIDIKIKESYYSISHKDVIRGMHFQKPPYDHLKIVYVSYGKILDVVLDIRKNSKTYGKYFSLEIEAHKKALVIPSGFAHGFKSLEDNTIVHYMQTSCYIPEYDDGIRYDSFGFDWKCGNPITSNRDLSFKTFNEFDTPFIWGENR